MNKHEFKRAWRDLRTEARAVQKALPPMPAPVAQRAGCVSAQHDRGRVIIAIGYCDTLRAASSSWLGQYNFAAQDVRELVRDGRNYDSHDERRRTIASARRNGPVRIPQ